MAQDTVSLQQVIYDFMISVDQDDYASNASEVFIKSVALRGVREMGFDLMKRIKATTLAVDATTNTVSFPCDYVDYTKIGKIGRKRCGLALASRSNSRLISAFFWLVSMPK